MAWFVVVGVAAAWRVGILVFDKWRQPLLLNDSIYYSGQAIQLADGTFFREIFVDQPGAEHGPLTSTLLALVSWVDAPTPWQRLLTVAFGIATVVVIGLLGREVGGERVGVVAAGIAAVYPNLWMNDGLVMSESISVLVVSAVLLVAVRAAAGPGRRAAVVIGVLAGLGALARSELVLLVPGMALLLWWGSDRRRPARERLVLPALTVGVALAVMAPWVAFNLARFERPVTLTTNDGTTLVGSYCDETFSGAELGGWSLSCVVNDPLYRVDEEPSVRSARQRGIARRYAVDHLAELPKVAAARLARSLDLYDLGNLVHQDVGEERYRWAAWAGVVSWWTLAPFAVFGFIRLDRRARALFALPCVAVLIVSVVFYGGHRIRSSMEPVVVVCAALAFLATLDRLRHRRLPGGSG